MGCAPCFVPAQAVWALGLKHWVLHKISFLDIATIHGGKTTLAEHVFVPLYLFSPELANGTPGLWGASWYLMCTSGRASQRVVLLFCGSCITTSVALNLCPLFCMCVPPEPHLHDGLMAGLVSNTDCLAGWVMAIFIDGFLSSRSFVLQPTTRCLHNGETCSLFQRQLRVRDAFFSFCFGAVLMDVFALVVRTSVCFYEPKSIHQGALKCIKVQPPLSDAALSTGHVVGY